MPGRGELPDEFLLATIQQQMAANPPSTGSALGDALLKQFVRISNLTSTAASGTVDVEFTDGAATLGLAPRGAAGSRPVRGPPAQRLGVGVPPELVDAISESLADAARDAAGQMNVDKLEVKDGLIELTVSQDNPQFRTQ